MSKDRVRDSGQFGWYETQLSLNERKQRGHFSTPLTLVDQILNACGYSHSVDLLKLRVLDPACGSGNFLARVAQRLCLSAQAQGIHETQLKIDLSRNIWGLDPDPVACFLAEMQVRTEMERVWRSQDEMPRIHIHQADSLTLPWDPCVDLLLANPPYLATKNSDLSHYRQAQRRGQSDSYLLFLDLALQAVRPGGWIGLVLPDPVLARANAAPERVRLLRECTLHSIWHLARVFSAEVGAVVLIAQKTPPSSTHEVSWIRATWRDELTLCPPDSSVDQSHKLHQHLLAEQPGAALRYLLGNEQGKIMERLRSGLANTRSQGKPLFDLLPLAELVEIRRGEEIGRESGSIRKMAELEDGVPVLRGGIDVQPYKQPETDWSISRTAIKKPIERYLQPKLLVVKSTGRLQATLDTEGHVALQTLYLLHVRTPDEQLNTHYFLLALLNSRVLRDYVYHMHTAYKMVQPQIEQTVLAHLPIPWNEANTQIEIVQRAKLLEHACSTSGPVVKWNQWITSLYEEQEYALRMLYASVDPDIFKGQRSLATHG